MSKLEQEFLKNLSDLNDTNPKVRRDAALRLGEIGKVEAVEPLLANLAHEDEIFRKAIVRALKQIDDDRAIEPLLQRFKIESSVKVKALIAWALGHFIYVDFNMDSLTVALDDESIYLKRMIIFALGNNRYKKAVPKLIELTNKKEEHIIRKMAIWALKETQDQRALETLIKLLNDSDRKIRKKVSSILPKFPYTYFKAKELIEILDDKNHLGRRNTIYVLGKIRYISCVPKLIEIIKSNQPIVIRKEAMKALKELRDKRAFKTLFDLIDDPLADIRAAAIYTLLRHWNLDINKKNLVFNHILKALDDESKEVRLNAIKYIFQYYSHSLVKYNKKFVDEKITDLLFNDPNPEIRAEIVGKFFWYDDRRLSKIKQLKLILNDSSPLVRTLAYYKLVTMNIKVDLVPLIKELNNPTATVRKHAFWALNRAKITMKIKDVLQEELANENHKGRVELICIISEIKSHEIVSVLIDLIKNDKNDFVRTVAVRVLHKQNDVRIKNVLIDALKDPSKEVRHAAMFLLRYKGYHEVYRKIKRIDSFSYFEKMKTKKKIVLPDESIDNIPMLIDILKTSKNKILRMRAAVTLVKHTNDESVFNALIVALNDTFDRVRSTAAYALTSVKNPKKIDPLLRALNDPSIKVRYTAKDALFRDKDCIIDEKKLIEIINDKKNLGRYCAVLLLGNNFVQHRSIFENLMNDDDANIQTIVRYYLSENNI